MVEKPIDEKECAKKASGESCVQKGPLLDSPLDVCGIIGFGLYLAWFYLVLTCSVESNPGIARETRTLLILVFLLGEALSAIVVAPNAARLANRKSIRILVVVAGTFCILPGVASLIPMSETVLFAAWLFAGSGAVLLLSLWGFFLARLAHRQASAYAALSVLIAVLMLSFVRVCFKESVFPFASVMVVVTSAALFAFWASLLWSKGMFVYPENVRPFDWNSLIHSAVAMVANSFLLGFAFYAISIASGFGTGVLLCSMLAASIFKIVDANMGPVYQVNVIVKVIAPVAAACLLFMPFAPLWGRYVLLFFMLMFAMTNEIVCWTAVAEYMHVHRVQPFANMSFGRFGDIVGLFLGFGCSAVVFGSSLEGSMLPNVLVSIVVVGFVFMQAFFFKDSYTPFVEHKEMDEDLAEDRVSEEERPRYGSWIRRCHLFAEKYGLTPRQTEVLLLLARGYSMGSIERELVVSSHTVKAHVYGIYQKADIHSRQELIERIGEFEDDGVRTVPSGKPMQ